VYTSTASNGVATFNLSGTALATSGTYSYSATDTGLTSATATETVNTGPLAALSLTGLVSSTAQIAQTANVRAVDAYGNTVTGFTGTVTLTTTDTSATVTPPSYAFTAGDAGSKNFVVTFNTAGTYSAQAQSGAFTGSQTGIVIGDAVWVLAATGQRAEITESGTGIVSGIGTAGTAATLGGIAIDSAGGVWSVTSATNALAHSTFNGATPTTYSGGGLNAPVSVAVDGAGMLWVANSGDGSVSEFSNAGAALTSNGADTLGVSGASSIAVDISGSVWVANPTSNSVTRILGAATPVVSPTSAAIGNRTQGSQP
jgi:hypothetical protein